MVYPPQETETGFTVIVPVTPVILGCLNELRQVIRNESNCYPGFTDEDRVNGMVSDLVDCIWSTRLVEDYRSTSLLIATIHEHVYECEPEEALQDETKKHKVINVIDRDSGNLVSLAFSMTEYLLSTLSRLRQALWPSLMQPIYDCENQGFLVTAVNCKYVASTGAIYLGVSLSE